MKNNFKEKYDLNYEVNPHDNCVKYVKAFNEKKFNDYLYDDPCVKSDYCNSLISIIFNTNSIDQSYSCIENFVKKTKNPEKLQFCIKIDNDNDSYVKDYLKKHSKLKTNILVLSSPKGRGYIDLWQWINFLYKVSSKKSYFVLNISDEMKVKQTGWDTKLLKYKSKYPDNIFRLRTSVYKNRNYGTLDECGYAPDTTAIYTKKYLEIQGKSFSPCFGPDNGQQFVAYYLSKLNYPRHFQYLRDIVINEISFLGQGTNVGIHEDKLHERQLINYLLWCNMFKRKFQENYFHRARKIQLAIIKEITSFQTIKHIQIKKLYKITTHKGLNNKRKIIYLNYKINKFKYFFERFNKFNFFKYQTSYDMPYLIGVIYHIILRYLKIHPKKIFSKNDMNAGKIDRLRNFWQIIKNKSLLPNRKFIFPIDVLIKSIVFLDIKKFLIFCIYVPIKTFFVIMLCAFRPHNIIFFISDLIRNRHSSIIIKKNNSDQSETIMIKGD